MTIAVQRYGRSSAVLEGTPKGDSAAPDRQPGYQAAAGG